MDTQMHINEEPETEVNLHAAYWDLLAQWKAIIAVALIMAIAIPGLKLLRDNKSYRASQKSTETEYEQEIIPASQKIEQIYEGMTFEDRAAVETLVQQQQNINTQILYLQNSLLLNTNPTHQRTLSLRYVLHADGDTQLLPLIDAYQNILQADELLSRLGANINPQVELSYIGELISIPTTNISALDSGTTEYVLPIDIVIPDGVAEGAINEIVTTYINEIDDTVTTSIGQHSIRLSSSRECYTYNEPIANRKSSIINAINSSKTSLKSAVTGLTTNQKASYDSIISALNNEYRSQGEKLDTPRTSEGNAPTASADTSSTPRFSFKYMLMGFGLGIILYVVAYILIIIARARVDSSDSLCSYTGTRSLGVLCYPRQYAGFKKIFHSTLVSNLYHAKHGDVSVQMNRIASTTSSVCEHSHVRHVDVLFMGESKDGSSDIVTSLQNHLTALEIEANTYVIDTKIDERALLPIQNAIIVVDETVKAANAWNLSTLCSNYDINLLGNVFICWF